MATTRETLKKWFSRGAYPSAGQFAALIDSFFHKDDKIPAASVEGLTDTLNGKADAATVDSIKKQQEQDAGRIGDLETATGELFPKVIDLGEYTPGKGFYLDEDLEEIAAVMLAATKGKAPLLLKATTQFGEPLFLGAAAVNIENGVDYRLTFLFDNGRSYSISFEAGYPDTVTQGFVQSGTITSETYTDTTDYEEI